MNDDLVSLFAYNRWADRRMLDACRKLSPEQYAAEPAAAKKLLSVGESKRNEKLDVTEHAAFTGLCNLILNLDEALTKE